MMIEAFGHTAYYTWRAVDRATVKKIQHVTQDFVRQGLIPEPAMHIDDMHMSIIRTENEIPTYTPDKQTIHVRAKEWRLLGGHPNYYLVLICDLHPRVDRQVHTAAHLGAKFVFKGFLPHISVAQYKTNKVDVTDLPLPSFTITLEAEEVVQFNDNM